MIRNEKTYGFFRKTKKYGLVGCISFCGILVYGLTDNNQIVNKQAHAAVVKGGADIVDADVHNKNIFPAYHMNKKHWISIVLDKNIKLEAIKELIDISYSLVK